MSFFSSTPSPDPVMPTPEDIQAFCTAVRASDKIKSDEMLQRFGDKLINARDNIDAIPLTWAAYDGNLEMVGYLLDRGANIEGRGTDDRSPLGWAVSGNHYAVAKLLLERGASMETPDRYNVTPLGEAEKWGRDGMKELLKEWPETQKQLKLAEERRRVEELAEARRHEMTQKQLEHAKGMRVTLKKKSPRP